MKEDFKVVLIAGTGAVLEVYDFLLYVLFSAQIVNTFFAGIDDSLIKSFITIAIFSLTYIVRPLGAVTLGILGDRYGRKKIFTFTIILMGISSLLMGIMPSYATFGVFASIAFVMFRILQGFALSGELPAAYVIVYETSTKNIGFKLSILFAFVLSGFLFATTVCLILEYLFDDYAWRIGFVLGGFLAIFGYYARLRLTETPLFRKIASRDKKSIITLFKQNYINIFIGFCFAMLFALGAIILLQYSNFYIAKLLNTSNTSLIMIPVQIIVLISVIVFGYISDKVGLSKMYIVGCLILLITIPVIFYLMSDTFSVFMGMIFLIICYSVGASTTLFFLCDIFPTEFRLSGVALSYSLNSAFVGGVCPIVAATIITKTGTIWLGPTIICMICLIFALFAIFLYKKLGISFYKKSSKII
ncbi:MULTISPECIES: MFS transporter [Francisella]|uniref:MFS transporter n=1 Tax=Francisella salimarina TaxID=2599927 RepID=A0AAJ4NNA5_9GAMM|nr:MULTISPECIES: MFS transporter [Francisella]QWU98656.1 MFS transporter [Francisella salimarina]